MFDFQPWLSSLLRCPEIIWTWIVLFPFHTFVTIFVESTLATLPPFLHMRHSSTTFNGTHSQRLEFWSNAPMFAQWCEKTIVKSGWADNVSERERKNEMSIFLNKKMCSSETLQVKRGSSAKQRTSAVQIRTSYGASCGVRKWWFRAATQARRRGCCGNWHQWWSLAAKISCHQSYLFSYQLSYQQNSDTFIPVEPLYVAFWYKQILMWKGVNKAKLNQPPHGASASIPANGLRVPCARQVLTRFAFDKWEDEVISDTLWKIAFGTPTPPLTLAAKWQSPNAHHLGCVLLLRREQVHCVRRQRLNFFRGFLGFCNQLISQHEKPTL